MHHLNKLLSLLSRWHLIDNIDEIGDFMKTLLFVLGFSILSIAQDCIEVQAAFDIGSGTTKMKVAEVDVCKQSIIKMLLEKDAKVEFKEALETSEDNTLSESILNQGVDALISLKQQASVFNPVVYKAVATSAFRTATNSVYAKNYLKSKTNIEIKVISQEQEANIGFIAASTLVDADLKNIVVWDIGGGSMQITTLDEYSKLDIYEGKVASVSFKNHIIEQVQYKSLEEAKTPNPISTVDYNLARRDSFAIAALTTSKTLRNKLKEEGVIVIGIGGVHKYSIAGNIGSKNYYTRDEVTKKVSEQLGKTDEEVGGKYASTDVSNLILVKGFLDALEIDMVHTGNVNLATGLLLMPSSLE